MSFKTLLKHVVLSTALLTTSVMAAGPTAAQIEQFKKLPKAQQEQLAKSMGVDLKALSMGGGASSQAAPELTEYMSREEYEEYLNSQMEEQGIEDFAADEEEDELKPFGYDVFANGPSTFTPNLDVAVPESYIVGPGDTLSIQVFGKENLDYELPVSREGKVVVPNLGPFNVVGLTHSEMKRFLSSKIKQRILGVDVVVSIASLRSMRVFVLGDAYKPGPYVINSLSSVTHAIFAAGGISDIGSLRNIQIKRAGKLVKQVDLYDFLIEGDSSDDVLLQAGDVVFVAPVGKRVTVDGEVRRPGIYEINQGESYADVIRMVGGLLPEAYPKVTRIERFDENNLREVINVNLANKSASAKFVKNGDVISVLKTSDVFDQSIEVFGAATRPGTYQFIRGHKITDVFPNIKASLLEEADLNYSIIVREIDLARNIEIVQFNLANAINNPNSVDNVELQIHDKIIIFSNTEIEMSLDTDEDDEEAEAKLLAQLRNKGLEQLIEESEENEDGPIIIEKLKENARFKLLAPIIEKLKQQGAAGKPMQLVEVDGQVKYPGIYPLPKNSNVAKLVAAAGGVTESAYLARADITRNTLENETARKISLTVNLAAALNNSAADNIALQSKDRLNVHTIPAWSENHTVNLVGEFRFPGKYTIRRGETLSDIIVKAGGFTDYAFPEGGVFTREKLKVIETQNIENLASELRLEIASKSLTEGTEVTYEETQLLLTDLTDIEPVGRLVLSVPKIIQENQYDVVLEDGDSLYIPTQNHSINVVGQVNVSTSHMFDEHLTVEDYLRKSGGLKQRAQEDGVYVIAANGDIKTIDESNWFSSDESAMLQPGDTIVVPLDSGYMNNLSLWSSVTQIMYNTAVAIAAISGL